MTDPDEDLTAFQVRSPWAKRRMPIHERPSLRFPGGASVAVRIYVAVELVGRKLDMFEGRVNDIGSVSEIDEYSFEVGVWRALAALKEFDLRSSFYVSAAGLERYPRVGEAILSQGHELAAHGMYQNRIAAVISPRAERMQVERCTEVIDRLYGVRPKGWISPYALSTDATIEAVADAGYLWHGDLRDDDLPYGLEVHGRTIVELPHRTHTTNDFAFFAGHGIHSPIKSLRTPEQAVDAFASALSNYRETSLIEGGQSMDFGIHAHVHCFPDRIVSFRRMLRLLTESSGESGLWLTSPDRLAAWWFENHLK